MPRQKRQAVRRRRVVVRRRRNAPSGVRTGRGAYGGGDLLPMAIGAAGELSNAIPAKRENTFVNKLAKALGAVGGAAAGFAAGGPVGAMHGGFAGGVAGNALSRWFGYGRYKVKTNSILMDPTMPMHQNNEKIILRHRECLGDVFSAGTSGAFSVQAFTLNPGIFTTFPWLAAIAQNFQFWKPRGIVATFISELSEGVGSSVAITLGSVMMATLYDSTAPAPVSKISMLNEHFACESKASMDLCHPIECDPSQRMTKELLVRTAPTLPANDDPRLYDLGKLYVASTGVPTSSNTSVQLGTLWIEYEIELNMPVTTGIQNTMIPVAHYSSTSSTNANVLAGMNLKYDTIGITIGVNLIQWPDQAVATNYIVYIAFHGNSTTSLALTGTPSQGASSILLFKNDGNSQWDDNGATSTDLFHVRSLNVLYNFDQYNGPPTYTFSAATLPASVTQADLWVFALPSAAS